MNPHCSLAPVLLAAALACNHHPAQSFAGLSRVSGESPFPAGCVNQAQQGVNFRNAEVEPFLAVDPADARHLVGVWQQDRWSNGGSNGLGSAVSFDSGATWAASFPAFTTCSGGTLSKRTNFERATDPWVAFGADGAVHQIAFAFNGTNARGAMLAVRSADQGKTWSDPFFLTEDNDPDVAIDKETLTADPQDPNLLYAVWDRLTGLTSTSAGASTGPAWFARSIDGGLTWQQAQQIYDPGTNKQTIGNQIVVLPGGTLAALVTVIEQLDQRVQPTHLAVLLSGDRGATWGAPHLVSDVVAQGVLDPKNHVPVRTGDLVAEIGVDRGSSALYVVWEDSRFTQNARDGIALSSSADGGLTWSAPAQVNGDGRTQAFTPAIAVAQGGRIGVTYYDLRNDNPGDDSQLLATAWLATSGDGGRTWQEGPASPPFDLRSAARVDEGYFLGDYQGLVAAGASFIPLFALANNGNSGNRSDIFARPPSLPRAAQAVEGAPMAVPRSARGGLRRAY